MVQMIMAKQNLRAEAMDDCKGIRKQQLRTLQA